MQNTTMSKKELKAAGVIARCLKGSLGTSEAAEELGVDPRTVRRMKERVREGGPSALAHGLRGRGGNRAMSEGERGAIADVLRDDLYAGFGPTLAAEKLAERHGIVRDPKTVRGVMAAEGLWLPKALRKAAPHLKWRRRRERSGEMSQFDGSYEPWLEDRLLDAEGNPAELCMLLATDDATGGAERCVLARNEGVLPVMDFWLGYALERGLPEAVYVDRFSTYSMNARDARDNPDTLTQFQRAMRQLGTEIILARSPQAKGRVERAFGTLQDRLVKEMRLEGISTVGDANRFIAESYLPEFNRRFAVPAAEGEDRHSRLTAADRRELPYILCRVETRKVQNDFCVRYGNRWLQLLKTPRLTVRPKDEVTVHEMPDGTLAVRLRGKDVLLEELHERPAGPRARIRTVPTVSGKRTFLIPGKADISKSL